MNKKRIIAFISAIAVICGSVPFSNAALYSKVTAADSGSDDNNSAVKARIIGEGHSGGSTSWVLTDDGTLTIKGTGDMYDFKMPSVCPWIREQKQRLIRKVVIEEGITSIASCAFSGCDEITQVIIPDSVTRIGREAFCDCSKIKELKIPDSVKIIGDEALEMENLEVLEISSETMIGKLGETFKSSPYYTELSAKQKTEDKITFMTIGSILVDILPAGADKALPEEITLPDNITSVSGGCFENKTVKYVNLPESLKYISDSAFKGSSLSELIIPDSVEYIGSYAFSECISLSEVALPASLEYIDSYAFSKCEKLKRVNIPENVKTINDRAFTKCSGMESVNFAGSPEKIGDSAFGSCSSLTEIRLSLKDTEIGENAFSGCTLLKTAEITGSLKILPYNIFRQCTSLSKVILPEDLEEIGPYAFEKCSSLKEFEIPASVNSIGNGAFSSTALSSVMLPDNLDQLGSNVFENCPELTTLCIPPSVERIMPDFIDEDKEITIKGMKYSAAYEIALLKNAEFISDGEVPYNSGFCGPGDEYWKLDDNGTLTITGEGLITMVGTSTFLDAVGVIIDKAPASVDFSFLTRYPELDLMHSIKKIEFESPAEELDLTGISFADSTLESVKLPITLKKINADSFKGCTSLKSVSLPDSLTDIADGAFDGCTSLETVEFYKSGNMVSEESEKIAQIWHMPAAKGDIDGNNSVDMSDVLVFSKWMLGDSETKMINRSGAKVTDDNNINIADFVALKDLIINGK